MNRIREMNEMNEMNGESSRLSDESMEFVFAVECGTWLTHRSFYQIQKFYYLFTR